VPAGLEPGGLGQFRSQRLNGNPNVSHPPGSRYAISNQAPQRGRAWEMLQIAEYLSCCGYQRFV